MSFREESYYCLVFSKAMLAVSQKMSSSFLLDDFRWSASGIGSS